MEKTREAERAEAHHMEIIASLIDLCTARAARNEEMTAARMICQYGVGRNWCDTSDPAA
jgi:hypothetical protein